MFHIVCLKNGDLEYYLVDSKMTISLDRSSAMVFVDKELATDYASKVEYRYAGIEGWNSALGYTKSLKHFYELQ